MDGLCKDTQPGEKEAKSSAIQADPQETLQDESKPNAVDTTTTNHAAEGAKDPAHGSQESSRPGFPYWERLPSRNLSFGSAEILTVDECLRHGALYREKAVRVTGLLHQRTMQNDRVVLELKNPLSRLNTLSSSSSYNAGDNKKKRPLPGSASKVIAKRKPWFASSKRTPTETPVKAVNVQNTKTTSSPKTPPKTILQVHVDIRLRNISTLTVGSLVMVIGIVQDDTGTIEARLLQNVNSTDMTFYTNALKARRKFLYERYKSQQKGDKLESAVPLQGCCPPPYPGSA